MSDQPAPLSTPHPRACLCDACIESGLRHWHAMKEAEVKANGNDGAAASATKSATKTSAATPEGVKLAELNALNAQHHKQRSQEFLTIVERHPRYVQEAVDTFKQDMKMAAAAGEVGVVRSLEARVFSIAERVREEKSAYAKTPRQSKKQTHRSETVSAMRGWRKGNDGLMAEFINSTGSSDGINGVQITSEEDGAGFTVEVIDALPSQRFSRKTLEAWWTQAGKPALG